MRTSTLFSILTTAILSSLSLVVSREKNATNTILSNAEADAIDLTVLDDVFHAAMKEILTVSSGVSVATREEPVVARQLGANGATPSPNNIVDVHSHITPSWYKALAPTIGGTPAPDWNWKDYLSFNAQQGIDRVVLSFSVPGPNVYLGNKVQAVALARLINEQMAAYCRLNKKYNFYAHVPFPYTAESITEARYAMKTLGAVGIFLQSSAEGKYLGDPTFKPFFQAINALGGRQILYIHPAVPYMKIGGKFVEANPTPYITGKIEFYFETALARTLMDLTLTQTIHNFTNIHYVIPHVGGGFPATLDRILKSYPAIYDSSFKIYNTRFWWDSAGPTYFHQVAGLLAYGIPKSQLLYGTDYPYAPAPVQPSSQLAVKNSPLFTAAEKAAVFSSNAERLFGAILNHNKLAI